MLYNGFIVDSDGVLTTYCGKELEVTIPKTVKHIGNTAFYKRRITSVYIPGSVKTIGDSAFRECTSLRSVTIGEGCERIGRVAFYKTAITSINIPGSVKAIDDQAFRECMSLRQITIGNGCKRIGRTAFYKDPITKISIPGSVEIIDAKAFLECTALRDITVGEGCKEIGEAAFWCRQPIEGRAVRLPSTIKKIDKDAFYPVEYADKLYTNAPTTYLYTSNNSVTIDYAIPYSGIKITVLPTEAEIYDHRMKKMLEEPFCFSKDIEDVKRDLILERDREITEKRAQRLGYRHNASYSSYGSDSGLGYGSYLDNVTTTTSTWDIPDHGPLATAFNCGMPYIDSGEMLDSQAGMEPIDLSDM